MNALRTSLLLALSACGAALPPPSNSVDLRHTDDVRAVFQVSGDAWRDGHGTALHYVDKITGAYEELGVPLEAQHFVMVFHGDAGYHVVNDAAFAAYERRADAAQTTNPNQAIIARLIERGVRVEICSSTMRQKGWQASDLLPGVIVTPNAFPRIIDLQMDGYAHILFD